MYDDLTLGTQKSRLVIWCECGTMVAGENKQRLIDNARLHFGEFHPDLGAGVPADLILAMAEEMESENR